MAADGLLLTGTATATARKTVHSPVRTVDRATLLLGLWRQSALLTGTCTSTRITHTANIYTTHSRAAQIKNSTELVVLHRLFCSLGYILLLGV